MRQSDSLSQSPTEIGIVPLICKPQSSHCVAEITVNTPSLEKLEQKRTQGPATYLVAMQPQLFQILQIADGGRKIAGDAILLAKTPKLFVNRRDEEWNLLGKPAP
jgi:hypothetical protein